MRFEFTTDMITLLKANKELIFGIEHENYQHAVKITDTNVIHSLCNDFL